MNLQPSAPARTGAANAGAAPQTGGSLYLITRVGAERFAFPVSQVEEIVDAPGISPVPGTPESLLGQMRYRDRTVRAYAAGRALGVRTAPDGSREPGTAIVLRSGELRAAVVVDEVEDLRTVDTEVVRAVPVGADPEKLLRGVCFLAGRRRELVSLVWVEALLAHATAGATRVAGSER